MSIHCGREVRKSSAVQGFFSRDFSDQVRSYTLDDFNKNPKDRRLARMQHHMYEIRYHQYVDALAHLFNTGQGIVMDRCVYSDMVHVEAAFKHGYLSKVLAPFFY